MLSILQRIPAFRQRPVLWLALLCLWALSGPLAARPLLVLSDDTLSYHQVEQTLGHYYAEDFDSTTAARLEREPEILKQAEYDAIVAIGTRATRILLERLPSDSPRLLSTLIPRRSYDTLLRRFRFSPVVKQRRITAIFLDQPYSRQLYLAQLIRPGATSLGVAFSENSAQDLPLLEKALGDTTLQLQHQIIKQDQNPISQLHPLLEQSDVFLTLPDKAVFNRTTAKWILYISVRLRVPLIGFSRKYVEAGAVAGVHSSPIQIGRQSGELLTQISKTRNGLPPPRYPKYFSVSTNAPIARQLQLELPSAAELDRQLKEAEE